MKFKEYKIKEICDIKSGKRLPNGSDFSIEKTNYPYIRARDIKNGKISDKQLAYIDEKTYCRIKRYTINEGDVAITIVANIGDVGYCEKKLDGVNLTENAVRLTNFIKNINSRYLTYYLSQPFVKEYMENLAAGAAQSKLGIYKIQRIKVVLPELEYQNNVVSTISKYDDLIEKNNRKIAILEEQIQELYKEWFVRFRFPGHGKIKYKKCSYGRIPIDFEIFKAREVIEDYIGGGWGEEDASIDYNIQAYVIRGTDFERFKQMIIQDIPLRYQKESNIKQRLLKADNFIIEISGGTEDQPVGRICYVTKESLSALSNCVICASFCKSFTINTNIVYPLYFYYFMKTLYDFRALDRYQLQSTGISNFKFEYFLRKCEIIVPPRKLMQLFDEKVKKIMNLINYLYRENRNMMVERDLLLHRLMSGKLEVKG